MFKTHLVLLSLLVDKGHAYLQYSASVKSSKSEPILIPHLVLQVCS
jgi:hypothetical protein